MEQMCRRNHPRDFVGDAHKLFDRFLGPLGVDDLLVLFEFIGRWLVVLVEHPGIDVEAGVIGEQFFLGVGPFRVGRGVRLAKHRSLIFRELFQRLFKGLVHKP